MNAQNLYFLQLKIMSKRLVKHTTGKTGTTAVNNCSVHTYLLRQKDVTDIFSQLSWQVRIQGKGRNASSQMICREIEDHIRIHYFK